MSNPPQNPSFDPAAHPPPSQPQGQPDPNVAQSQPHPDAPQPGQPYSDAPPQGQPDPYAAEPGQPYPPPGQPGQYPGQQYPPVPEPKKKSPLGRRVALAIGALAVAGFGIYQGISATSGVEVGNCLVITGESADDPDHSEIDCADDSQFSMKVVKVSGEAGQCDVNASEYSISTGRGRTTVACLQPNFKLDQCYSTVDNNSMFEPQDCGSAEFKVTQMEDSTTLECTPEEILLDYTDPAKRFCLGDPAS